MSERTEKTVPPAIQVGFSLRVKSLTPTPSIKLTSFSSCVGRRTVRDSISFTKGEGLVNAYNKRESIIAVSKEFHAQRTFFPEPARKPVVQFDFSNLRRSMTENQFNIDWDSDSEEEEEEQIAGRRKTI